MTARKAPTVVREEWFLAVSAATSLFAAYLLLIVQG